MSSGMEITENQSPITLVCQTLRAATDANHDTVKRAEAQLHEWEEQPGFFGMLAQISTNMQFEVNVRWMAVVLLKNDITKYWRRGAKQELQASEKEQIRDILLAHCTLETVPQVQLQMSVLVAQIARIDCPHDWPQLLPHLLDKLHATYKTAVNEQYRTLLVMHHVIKALASRRYLAKKRVFEELSSNIFEFIHKLWQDLTQNFFEQLEQLSQQTNDTLASALLTLRILRKLLNYGFNKPYKFANCLQFVEQLFECLPRCLKCRYDLKMQFATTAENLIAQLEKFILKQIKTLIEFQDRHATSFARFVPTALEFSFNYVFHDGARYIFTNNVINFRNFVINCINLLKGIMLCHNSTRTTTTAAAAAAAVAEDLPDIDIQLIKTNFFSTERLSYICEKIISHYFLLTQMELDNWQDDAEGFAQDDAGESWKYALTPCVENLYCTCIQEYPKQMTAEVLKFVHKAQATVLVEEQPHMKDILLKDAIYKAVGLTTFQFFNEIDFNSWFSGQLLMELRLQHKNFRIIRRRIIWLIGNFACVQFSRDLRPMAYEACLHLLGRHEDMAVRLAASQTLYTLIREYEFAPNMFLPYLTAEFDALFLLLHEARECETKMNVLTIMSGIVDTMSDYMENQADDLIGYLPLLWKESEDFNMLRCAIISTLQELVKAFCNIPDSLRSFSYSVIEISTDLQQPCHVYLMEEGLLLWLCVIENSIVMNDTLLQLCKNLLPIIEMSSENLRSVLFIIQAYILLDGRMFLQLYGRAFVEFCMRMFDDIRAEGAVLILKVFETCLKTESHQSIKILQDVLPYIFKQVHLNKELPMLMSMYLTIVARVLLIDAHTFQAMLQTLPATNAFENILDVWIDKMPLVMEADKRKLFCLAFSSLFVSSNNMQAVCERLPALLEHMAHTLCEIMHKDKENSGDASSDEEQHKESNLSKPVDSLVFEDENDLHTSTFCTHNIIDGDDDYKSFHYDRLRQLSLKDPVHKIHLDQCVQWHLNALRTQIGHDNYQILIQTVPASTLDTLKQYGCIV